MAWKGRGTIRIDPGDPVGAVPIPGEPLPSPSFGYRPQPRDLVVRIDGALT